MMKANDIWMVRYIFKDFSLLSQTVYRTRVRLIHDLIEFEYDSFTFRARVSLDLRSIAYTTNPNEPHPRKRMNS